MTAKVFATENIGNLVDELMQIGVYKITGFEWKSAEVRNSIMVRKKVMRQSLLTTQWNKLIVFAGLLETRWLT